jgi:hypothetical protein
MPVNQSASQPNRAADDSLNIFQVWNEDRRLAFGPHMGES